MWIAFLAVLLSQKQNTAGRAGEQHQQGTAAERELHGGSSLLHGGRLCQGGGDCSGSAPRSQSPLEGRNMCVTPHSSAPEPVVPPKTSRSTQLRWGEVHALKPWPLLAPSRARGRACSGWYMRMLAVLPTLWRRLAAATAAQDGARGTVSAGSSLALLLALPLVCCTGAACHGPVAAAAWGARCCCRGQHLPRQPVQLSRRLEAAAGGTRREGRGLTGATPVPEGPGEGVRPAPPPLPSRGVACAKPSFRL